MCCLGKWKVWQGKPQWERIKETLTDSELTLEEGIVDSKSSLQIWVNMEKEKVIQVKDAVYEVQRNRTWVIQVRYPSWALLLNRLSEGLVQEQSEEELSINSIRRPPKVAWMSFVWSYCENPWMSCWRVRVILSIR